MVLIAPVIPGLTDHEIPNIIRMAVEAGAKRAGYVMLRLPYGVSDLFQHWLDQYFPYKKSKILNRLRSIRGGKLNPSEFHERMGRKDIFAEQVKTLFTGACRKAGIEGNKIHLSHAAFRRPSGTQLKLL